MTTGEQIKQRREELHLSQEELAERIGVSRQAVSKWESGRAAPRGTNRDELCKLLSIELTSRNRRKRAASLLSRAGSPLRFFCSARSGFGHGNPPQHRLRRRLRRRSKVSAFTTPIRR